MRYAMLAPNMPVARVPILLRLASFPDVFHTIRCRIRAPTLQMTMPPHLAAFLRSSRVRAYPHPSATIPVLRKPRSDNCHREDRRVIFIPLRSTWGFSNLVLLGELCSCITGPHSLH